MATIKLIFRNDSIESTTIAERKLSDHAGFDAVFDALREMCLALDCYNPETVDEFFRPEESATRLLKIIKSAPKPTLKTDSQLAAEYHNWYFGARLNMTAAELKRKA